MACGGFVELPARRLLVVPGRVGEPSGVAALQGSDRWAGRGTVPAQTRAGHSLCGAGARVRVAGRLVVFPI